MASDLELVMDARRAELPGGLRVRRALPRARRRMVGPFVFVDQMGPVALDADRELTVLPHPHIGLSTITYLFEGVGLHQDSLGTVQRILPGEVNWMTAGRGIVHSERLRPGATGRVFGVQIWVALPLALEEGAPSFDHYEAEATARIEQEGVSAHLIAGSLLGRTSRVRTSSPLVYAVAKLDRGATFRVPAEYTERALFILEGQLHLGASELSEGQIGVLREGREVELFASEPTRWVLIGGEPLEGPRHILWNFVSSSQRRLERAAEDWRQQRFPKVPGETAYIPLPKDGDAPVDYP